MKNFYILIDSLENKITNAFIEYKESFKWYVLYIKFPSTTEIFIITKNICEDNVMLIKREKEILEYLKGKKLL